MRVTHVITRLIIGGAQENTVATVLGLRDFPDIEVDLVSGPTTGKEGSMVSSIGKEDLLELEPDLVRPVSPLRDLRAYRNLRTRFKRTKPRIVHTHSGKAGVIGRLAAASAGVPVIIHTIHGPSFGPFQGWISNLIFTAAERRAGRVTHHFISVADAMSQQYLAAGIGHPDQYTTIRSGFNLQPYLDATNDSELRQQLGLQPDDFVVGKIARLFKLKGHQDLFAVAGKIVEQAPKTKFLIVGDGPWRGKFERELAVHGLLPHFVFTGLIPPDQVYRYVGIMNCLVHLSLREGLPRALPQAMAAGKAVIAYDCDGAREVCLDGKTGCLLKPGDRATLVEKLVMLAQSSDLRHQLGENGRALVREQFDQQTMVDQIHALYRRLMKERGQ